MYRVSPYKVKKMNLKVQFWRDEIFKLHVCWQKAEMKNDAKSSNLEFTIRFLRKGETKTKSVEKMNFQLEAASVGKEEKR